MPRKSVSSEKVALEESKNKRLKPDSSKREHNKVDRFTETSASSRTEKPIVIKKGKGHKLDDIENVASQIKNLKKSDEVLRGLHGLLVGRVNKSVDIKGNLGQFSGLVYPDEKGRERFKKRLEGVHLRHIRDYLAFFGQDPAGERDDIEDRLIDFLEKPKASDKKYARAKSSSSSKKSSSSKSPKKKRGTKKDKKKGPKRPRSAYILFCSDKRDEVVKKHPNEKITEIAKRLGALWGKVSKEDAKKYKGLAEKDKARYEREMKKEGSSK